MTTRKPSKLAKKPASKPRPKPAAKAKAAPAKKAKKPEKPLPVKKAAAPAPPKAHAKGKAAKPASKPKVAKAPSAKKRQAPMPTGVAKPGLGHKWACFNCGAKFYDLGKPVPVCPKCEADQRDRPPMVAEPSPAPPQPKRPAMAPMSRFLDDDEVAAPETTDEFGAAVAGEEAEEPEAAEIDIESLEEPGGMAEGEFSEGEEE